jgi:hypothetical protein
MKLPSNFQFSQSSLQSYVNCPYQFYLRYIQNLAWPALQTSDALEMEAHMKQGNRFHALIHMYFLGLPQERLLEIAMADPLPGMVEWWDLFLGFAKKSITGTCLPELSLQTELVGALLMAKFDLLNIQDDYLVIYDWKTNLHPIKRSFLQKTLQTRVYPYILAKEYQSLNLGRTFSPDQVKMIYWQANSPEAPIVFNYSSDAHLADELYLGKLVSEIQSFDPGDFLKTSDHHRCKFCIYRSLCDRGDSAGLLSEFEENQESPGLDNFHIDLDSIEEIAI